MANFTPTSSIAWTQNHAFAMGMEANFTNVADTVASITQNIPFSIGELQIFGGSLTMQGNQKAAALFRIAIIGNAAGGDGGLSALHHPDCAIHCSMRKGVDSGAA